MSSNFYQGNVLNGLDGKYRLSIPARFRDVMLARSDTKSVMVIEAHASMPYLIGSDVGRRAQADRMLVEKHGLLDSDEREMDEMRLFGLIEEIPIEDTGRIVLGAAWRDHAKITDEALFLGMRDRFAIWNPDVAIELLSARFPVLPQLVAEQRRRRAGDKRGKGGGA